MVSASMPAPFNRSAAPAPNAGPELAGAAVVRRPPGSAKAALLWGELGPRQRGVAEGVLAGETNAQIGARLDMSVHTVREHLKRMAGRLGARGRAGLIAGLFEARARSEDGLTAAATGPGV